MICMEWLFVVEMNAMLVLDILRLKGDASKQVLMDNQSSNEI
jgi:hypothetical protein